MKLRHVRHFDLRKQYKEYNRTYELAYENKDSSVIMFSRKFCHPATLYGYKLWYYEVWVSYGEVSKYGTQIKSTSFYKISKSYKEAKDLFTKLLKLDYNSLKETLLKMYVNQEIEPWLISEEISKIDNKKFTSALHN